MDTNDYTTELRIIERGGYYLTPFQRHHIKEFLPRLSNENIKELIELGHTNINEALHEMVDISEVYLVRDRAMGIVFVGGIMYSSPEDVGQMFALFTNDIKENFNVLARGSKMLMSYFDKTHPMLEMTINARYDMMVQWATWLGFEIVGISEHENNQYVEFVRCNPMEKNVSHETSRPVMH